MTSPLSVRISGPLVPYMVGFHAELMAWACPSFVGTEIMLPARVSASGLRFRLDS